MSKRTDVWYDIVDFVEERGGALSGESRNELCRLVIKYAISFATAALVEKGVGVV
jgi:hypothetical protein